LPNSSDYLEESVLKIKKRIAEKIEDYEEYAFSSIQDCALKTFFDLAQEYDAQYDFYCICVLIPNVFFNYECILYLLEQDGDLKNMCHSADIYHNPPILKSENPAIYKEPTSKGDSFFLPVKGNMTQPDDYPGNIEDGILGIFEIRGASGLSENMKFFFEKYVNRIGFQLHNRIINEKNKEHLNFIKSLVNDIGHNVIVPNMFFKLFFRRMKGKIDRAVEIGEELRGRWSDYDRDQEIETIRDIQKLCEELKYINESMNEQFQQILSHYEQTSLFLETLLRRSHFEEGRYVLVPRRINIYEKIIKPQLNRYLPRLEERGISIDNQVAVNADKETMVVADVGLISQAYANLFSNAVKYTREVSDEFGRPVKYISFKMQILEGHFGEGKPGIKLNMFSTGNPISDEDARNLFQEGYRGRNTEDEYGTGHGLQFIKEVVEMHNGVVGYKAEPNGNDFYFILPA
jgi:signal transduction histidine kinase